MSVGEELGEAQLGNVQDVAWVRAREIGQNDGDIGDRKVGGSSDDGRGGLNSLGAAPARYACRRARAIVAPRQRVGRTGLVENETGHAGRAEHQHADDDGKSKPPHVAYCSTR